MSLHLGIDIGLTGARAAVIDNLGVLVGAGRSSRSGKEGGGATRDAGFWRVDAFEAARQAVEACGDGDRVASIGVGALGPCAIPVDHRGEPVAPVPLFSLDGRADAIREHLKARYGSSDHELGPDHAVAKLHWLRETNSVAFDRAVLDLDVTSFIVAALTGQAIMDPATLHDHVCQGIPAPLPVPAAASATAVAGELAHEAARTLGVRDAIPVAVGGYDSYVDLWAAGVAAPGDAGILAGSTIVIGTVVEGPFPCGDDLRLTPYIDGVHFHGGWTSTSGSLIDWSTTLTRTTADEIAMLAPGQAGVMVLPYFAGERAPVWDPAARGAIVGATLGTTPAAVHRAAVDAVALSALDIADRLISAGTAFASPRVCGGALRFAPLLAALADAMGQQFTAVQLADADAPARLGAHAAGYLVAPPATRIIEPNLIRHRRYREMLDLYRSLYPALRPVLHALGQFARENEMQ